MLPTREIYSMMRMFNERIPLSAFVGCMLIASPSFATEFYYDLGVVSDYRSDGLSQTSGDPAIQGGIYLEHLVGQVDPNFEDSFGRLVADAWFSQVDFGAEDDADIELDLAVGYKRYDLKKDSAYGTYYSVKYFDYQYPEHSTANYDFGELQFELSRPTWKVRYDYADDYANSGFSGQYLMFDYKKTLNEEKQLSLVAHVGYSFDGFFEDSEFFDYSLTLTKAIGDLRLSLSYLANDVVTVRQDNYDNDTALITLKFQTY